MTASEFQLAVFSVMFGLIIGLFLSLALETFFRYITKPRKEDHEKSTLSGLSHLRTVRQIKAPKLRKNGCRQI